MPAITHSLQWLCIYSSGDHSQNNMNLKYGVLRLWSKSSNQGIILCIYSGGYSVDYSKKQHGSEAMCRASGSNLVTLAWKGGKLSRGKSSSSEAQTPNPKPQTLTPTPKLASGKNRCQYFSKDGLGWSKLSNWQWPTYGWDNGLALKGDNP